MATAVRELRRHPIGVWLLEGLAAQSTQHYGPHAQPTPQHRRHRWWKVMCLTGGDYFSTLGCQPGIAALAAGILSRSEAGPGPVRIVANEPDACDVTEYREKTSEDLAHHHIPNPDDIVFLEITITDPSDFETELHVAGTYCGGYRVLRVASPAVTNAIAALPLRIRDSSRTPPHIYFDWSEGQSRTEPTALPDLRRRRSRPRHPGDPSSGRTRCRPATRRPRPLNPNNPD